MRWIFAGLIVLILVSGFVILRSGTFIIRSVDVSAEKVDCADADQIKNSSNLLGQNFFLLNSSKIRDAIKNSFLCVKDIEISRHFPGRVTIFASGREPKAILLVAKSREATQGATYENIATPSAEQLDGVEGLEVDEENIIFAKNGNTDIPKIYLRENLTLGQMAPGAVSDSLKILAKVKTYGLNITEGEILDNFFLIYPKENPRMIFKLGESLDTQLASLQLILQQAKIDGKDLEFIDLRFDEPVLKLAPKKN